ncbi:transglutaminase-like domain-containing protein [Virgisporangium aurantiacum]|nr:transglutaminase-like domain-containing protein [Virgisporangium aurantiacum]
MTSLGRFAPQLTGLPAAPAELAAIGHGLLIHEHIAPNYGVELSEHERRSVHLRRIEQVLEHALSIDPAPLTTARPPAKRAPGNCRHFTVLLVALLRAQGVPARARCGFGMYFRAGRGEDHWVAEYWNAAESRWVLVDGQLDAKQREMFGIGFDVLDVPRDGFLVAADAWQRCRARSADPDTFGLSFLNEAGYWWIAANMMRDAAALENVEVLPWDLWGAMPEPDDAVDMELFDELAAATIDPDSTVDTRRRLMEDERLRVPSKVRNAARQVLEDL